MLLKHGNIFGRKSQGDLFFLVGDNRSPVSDFDKLLRRGKKFHIAHMTKLPWNGGSRQNSLPTSSTFGGLGFGSTRVCFYCFEVYSLASKTAVL